MSSISTSHLPSPFKPVDLSAEKKIPTSKLPQKTVLKLFDSKSITSLQYLVQVHGLVLRSGHFQDHYVSGALLKCYANPHFSNFDFALKVFSSIPNPNVFIWNIVIKGCLENNKLFKAIYFYGRMVIDARPNKFTYPTLFKACSVAQAVQEGRQIHGHVVKHGIGSDMHIKSAGIQMYASFGRLEDARKLFYSGESDVVCWNTMIDGYLKCGDLEAAKGLFAQMPVRNIGSWNVMINGLAKGGKLGDARKLFDEMSERDEISWSSMVDGYISAGCYKEALEIFQQMQREETRPGRFILSSVLAACSNIGAIDQGRWVHAYLKRNSIKLDAVLGTALLDMYAKCGRLDMGWEVFEEMKEREIFTWNAMIGGLAIHGRAEDALELFSKMQEGRMKPNGVTLVGVLTACAHAGFVDKGLRIFQTMREFYGVDPELEHYGCMVDLLGRSGLFSEAEDLINSMPMKPNAAVWGALLGPVTTYFLEDIYESTGYHLASDSPAAIRYEVSSGKKSAPVNYRRGKKNLILSGWGDDVLLSEACTNPYYNSDCYQSYSELTHKNLERLNEHVIDYDLLEDLVIHVDKTFDEGAILVFLPGVSEIHLLYDRLAASYQFGGQASDWILPLHSSIASTDQKKVFLRPPYGIRKVIIATNIAETSITIDDVVYVIDSGRHKENRYNPQKKLSSMVEDWISQANARQRRGRAGRVRPGTCFCLYTHHRYEKLMRPFQVPEMLRMPLVELCLQIKLLSLGYIRPFLSKALEPPREEAMASAISLLYEVGALEGNEELTPLGQHLAKLPVDVLIGKMMLYGGIFGCLSSILSISAFLSYKSPFIYPKDERQNVERAKLALLSDEGNGLGESCGNDKQSDHLIMVNAYKKWEKVLHQKGAKAAQQFCKSYFLSSSVMHMIRDMRVQFGTLLADIGLVDLPKRSRFDRTTKEDLDSWFSDSSQPFNVYSDHPSIVKAVLCAGLYPNIAAGEEGITEAALNSLGRSSGPATTVRPVLYDGRREVYIHPSSVNSNLKAFQYPFHVFLEKVETNKVFIRDTSVVSPYSILLFGGSINIQHQSGIVIIDGWLKLTAPAQIAVLFKELRLTLHSILKELIRRPETSIIIKNEVLKSIVRLLLEEDKPLT